MNMEMNIRLKAVRTYLNLNQEKFASELGIKQGSLSDIERNRIGVSSRIIDVLVNKFEINSAWFHTGEGDMFLKENNYISELKNEGVGSVKNIVNNYNKVKGGNEGVYEGGGGKLTHLEKLKGAMAGIIQPIDNYLEDYKTRNEFINKNLSALMDISKKKTKYNELFFKELAKENRQLYDTYTSLKSILDFEFTLENLEDSDISDILLLFDSNLSNHGFSTELPNYKEYKQLRETELAKLLPFTEIFKNLSDAIEIFRKEMQKHGKSINYEDDLMPNEAELPSTDETQASKEL